MKGNWAILQFIVRLWIGAAIGFALSLLMFSCAPSLLRTQESLEIVNIGFWMFFASGICINARYSGLHCIICLISAVSVVSFFHYGPTWFALMVMIRFDLLIMGIVLLRALVNRLRLGTQSSKKDGNQ